MLSVLLVMKCDLSRFFYGKKKQVSVINTWSTWRSYFSTKCRSCILLVMCLISFYLGSPSITIWMRTQAVWPAFLFRYRLLKTIHMRYLWFVCQAIARVSPRDLISTDIDSSYARQMTEILHSWNHLQFFHLIKYIGDDAVCAFRDVIDVPLVVRNVRRSRKQVLLFDLLIQKVILFEIRLLNRSREPVRHLFQF
jgi:hypothetical protein